MNKTKFIQKLKSIGWKVKENQGLNFKLPTEMSQRYKNIPSEVIDFLTNLVQCQSDNEKSWFLTIFDYQGKSESAYKWNEFELMSLESAQDDNDESEEIKKFWNNHFPFLLSVKNGYEYFSICLEDANYGKIYKGSEPEFEETELIANNFDEFMEKFETVIG